VGHFLLVNLNESLLRQPPKRKKSLKVTNMRKEYDFSKALKNPYASMLKKPITIRLDK
jgi:hypothetical protein